MAGFAALAQPAVLALMGGGTAMSAYGTYKGSREQAKLYSEAEKEALREARVTERVGMERQLIVEQEEQRTLGALEAARGKAGVLAGGSALSLRDVVARRYEQEMLLMGTQTTEQARQARESADIYKQRAAASRKAGTWGMFTELLLGGAQMGKTMYDWGWFNTEQEIVKAEDIIPGRMPGTRYASRYLPSFR